MKPPAVILQPRVHDGFSRPDRRSVFLPVYPIGYHSDGRHAVFPGIAARRLWRLHDLVGASVGGIGVNRLGISFAGPQSVGPLDG